MSVANPPAATGAAASITDSINVLKQQRATAKASITRIKNALDGSTNWNPIDLECRLDIVSSYVKQIMAYQTEIEKINPKDDKRAEIEELCIGVRSKIMTLLGRNRHRDSSVMESTICSPPSNRLPHLKLPRFDGKYAEYKNFITSFKTLIHEEPSLSSIEKFNHLLSCLSGDALLTVKAFQITEANYPKALERLTERYDKKCLIFFDSIAKIFEIPKMTKPNASDLRKAVDTVSATYDSLLSLGSEKDVTNALIIHLVLSKVDFGTKAKWNDQLDYSVLPSWSNCAKVLIRRCQSLDVNEDKSSKSDNLKSNKGRSSNQSSLACAQENSQKCLNCHSAEHNIYSCPSFQNLPVDKRFEFVKQNYLCLNCLKKGHSVANCKSSHCRVCKKPHHSLLHRFELNPSSQSQSIETKPITVNHTNVETSQCQSTSYVQTEKDIVLLATALVEMQDRLGNPITVRALLDSGSQVNLISEDCVNRLQLRRFKTNINIKGIGESSPSITHKISACVNSRVENYKFCSEFYVLKKITNSQPEINLSAKSWNIPSHVVLADPWFYKRQNIDLLIGAEVFLDLFLEGQMRLSQALPVLQKTQLGWVFSGKLKASEISQNCHASTFATTVSNDSLDSIVRKFWELDEIPHRATIVSEEHNLCEQHFKENTITSPTGRFMVSLPFKQSPTTLGQSIETAKRRFLCLERKLLKTPDVLAMYNDFMEEYISLGHMSLETNIALDQKHYFIPHQVVLRPQSTTTKLRVVFDASSKSSSQFSLNDILMVGPTIQPELYDTLLRFRCRKFALTADITKMYRQILVNESDRKFQLIMWRKSPNLPIQTYKLNTVTYGTASAPFLAIRCLFELSQMFEKEFPLGSKVVSEDFYVDDMLSGADTIQELTDIQTEVSKILSHGGMQLAKWFSNHKPFMTTVGKKILKIGENELTKTLGMIWDSGQDIFLFDLSKELGDVKATKRNLLSLSCRLFDPLGLLCPITCRAKMLLQELWLRKLDLDEEIPENLKPSWQIFKNNLLQINTIKVPRYVNTSKVTKVQLHGFCDASMRGYGCCLYIRSKDNGKVVTRLLTAKSKVAPLKTKTLPRLELCAAHLLCRLWRAVKISLDHLIESITFWTDSEIVLYWIQTHPSKLSTFVANRISDIQEWTSNIVWRHVPTKENPADLVSRGCDVDTLKSSIWFEGPLFLQNKEKNWPISKRLELSGGQQMLENRKVKTILVASNREPNLIIDLLNRSSSFKKVLKIVTLIYRFLIKRELRTKLSEAQELEYAFLKIVESVQHYELSNEIQLINDSKLLQPSLQKLTPFIQNYNDGYRQFTLIRVGGRLLNAPDSYDTKFPLLLNRRSRLSLLYFTHLHIKNCHVGAKNLVCLSRQKCWVVNARELARKVVRSCMHCFRYKPKLLNQLMGNLPADRLQSVRPFLICGVDFCGPIYTSYRIRGRPPYKTYIAIFICFTSRAIHIEAVSDLSTNSFICVLKRFIGRRGLPQKIYSDNATNFVGTKTEMKKIQEKLFNDTNRNQLNAFAAEKGIEFVFIPPRAPHFGGLWEAAVKSTKQLLVKTVANANLTFEELATVLVEIEAILNSRPITPLSEDPNDGEALTPGHLLIGSAITAIQEEPYQQTATYAKRWQLISRLKAQFWSAFRREYLSELQCKTKWEKPHCNLQVGDLVLVHDENTPPQKWLLGRITAAIVGPDSIVRVADIQTKSGILRRPIHKLALIPPSSP